MHRAAAPLLIALLLLAVDRPASAVVPGAKKMLDLASEARPPAAPLRANFVERRADGPARVALGVIWDGAGRLRFDVQDLAAGTTRSRHYAAATAGGPVAAAPLLEAPLWLLWLLHQPRDALLDARAVDRDRTSLAHRSGDVLWVLGAGPRDAEVPQLHFDRASGRLRATVEVVGGGGDAAAVTRVELDGAAAADPADPRHAWPGEVRIRDGAETLTFVPALLELGATIDPSELQATPLQAPVGDAPAP